MTILHPPSTSRFAYTGSSLKDDSSSTFNKQFVYTGSSLNDDYPSSTFNKQLSTHVEDSWPLAVGAVGFSCSA
jgi:hypothetical protein